MAKRLLVISSAIGLTVAGTVALTSRPASAATTSVVVPVSCHFAPIDVTQPRFDTTVTVTAPSSVRAGRSYSVQVRVNGSLLTNVPVALYGFTINSTFTVSGASPAGAFTTVQRAGDVPQGGSVTPQTFTRRFTAGASGTTVTYAFQQYQYSMWPSAPGPVGGQVPTATCLPNAGGPVTIATTRVTGWWPW